MSTTSAPGQPGVDPTWCSSAKDLVTTAIGSSRVWATLGYGILNEIFWPSTGHPQIRDLGFIVAGGGQWMELKRLHNYEIATPAPWIPLPSIVHHGDNFTVMLEVVPDDRRDVVLVRYSLQSDINSLASELRLYPLLAPRLGSNGRNNTAWVAKQRMLAAKEESALCVQDSNGFARCSAGYVGSSDGWQDFNQNGAMTWTYSRAVDGNVALMGELTSNEGVLAIGFSDSPTGAETLVGASLAEGFDCIRERVHESWSQWGESLHCPGSVKSDIRSLALLSATVLKVCEDRHYPGAEVASLSIPWGNSHDDLGGYHLVWARDSVEAGFGMIAVQHYDEARSMAAYLIATQQEDGHWTQNFYPDGRPFWTGIQLDESAFPILLVAKLRELGQLAELTGIETMVRRAVGFLIRSGPVSPQDRWEENSGINPFTLSVSIAALVAAAEFLSDPRERDYCLSYADYLNCRIEDWLYVENTELAKQYQVDGYYLRLTSDEIFSGRHGDIPIANRGGMTRPAATVVSLDYLYLARLGLRRPHDPRMAATLRVVEGELRVETPSGPSFHRYNEDGYGEHEDGSPFDGTGVGRLWPLLTGERGHLAAQLGEDANAYLRAMAAMAGPGGMIPEQVWDCDPIAEHHLQPGKPSGSAMPLLWAHAEFIKLLATQQEGKPIELLESVVRRYEFERPSANAWHWRTSSPFSNLPPTTDLWIEANEPFRVHFGFDGWQDVADVESKPDRYGMHTVLVEVKRLAGHETCELTCCNKRDGNWEGNDHQIILG